MGVKNSSKVAMLQKIDFLYKVKERYGKLVDNPEVILAATRKEPHCPYRLVNILFSNKFSESLAQLVNVADLAELDAGKVANNQLFLGRSSRNFRKPR